MDNNEEASYEKIVKGLTVEFGNYKFIKIFYVLVIGKIP